MGDQIPRAPARRAAQRAAPLVGQPQRVPELKALRGRQHRAEEAGHRRGKGGARHRPGGGFSANQGGVVGVVARHGAGGAADEA